MHSSTYPLPKENNNKGEKPILFLTGKSFVQSITGSVGFRDVSSAPHRPTYRAVHGEMLFQMVFGANE